MHKAKQNLHTHSIYCDGNDTPEQVVQAAIEKGFTSIGFSGHAYTPFYRAFIDRPDETPAYLQEVRRLKEKYKGQLDIFCGLEVEVDVPPKYEGFDYLIGAVHYFHIGDEYVGFDRTAEWVDKIIDENFAGDWLKFAERYFSDVARLPQTCDFDILAHFDLVAKNAENVARFDETDPRYLSMGMDAIDALAGKIPLFEVNTGAIARGYRSIAYPAPVFLRRLREKGFGAVITSDCHDVKYLDYAFDDACRLLAACGFCERYVLTGEGFKSVPLEV